MDLQTFYVGRHHAYRCGTAAAAREADEQVLQVAAPAGAIRLWRLEGGSCERPYVTADWAMAWKLGAGRARRIQALEVVG